MSFMQNDITDKQDWYEVETTSGIEFVPADLVGDIDLDCDEPDLSPLREYCEGVPQDAEKRTGYGARLSAPGYMDCTEWAVFETETEAEEYLKEMYGDDEDED